MNSEDQAFLAHIEKYVTARPEVAAHVQAHVASGLHSSRVKLIKKSADMEIIVSFLMRSGKLSRSDKQFVVDKLKKLNDTWALDWSALIDLFESSAGNVSKK